MTTATLLARDHDGPDNSGDALSRSLGASTVWRDIAMPFLATRISICLVISLATRYLIPAGQAQPRWIECLSRFDGLWYLRIARDGYFFDLQQQSSIAFAPLLPMLMRCIGYLFGGTVDSYLIAGVVIANAALLVALIFVRAITCELFGERAGRRAVWYVLICPGTLYLSTVYPMSLMIAIGASSLWFARQGRWDLAGAIGMLGPLARPDGSLVFLPLLFEAARAGRVHRKLLWLFLLPSSLSLWMIGQWGAFGTPIAFIRAEQMWDPSPFITVAHSPRAPLILGTVGFFVLLTLLGWKYLPVAYSIYASLFLGVMLSASRLWSLPRYAVMLFPCFITLAWLGTRWRWLHLFYVICACLMAALFTLRFSLGLWVA